MSRIWDLRHNLTAYDAAYIALGEALNAPLVTRDKRIASAPGHRARIETIQSALARAGYREPFAFGGRTAYLKYHG